MLPLFDLFERRFSEAEDMIIADAAAALGSELVKPGVG
jgi:hypothetical protein